MSPALRVTFSKRRKPRASVDDCEALERQAANRFEPTSLEALHSAFGLSPSICSGGPGGKARADRRARARYERAPRPLRLPARVGLERPIEALPLFRRQAGSTLQSTCRGRHPVFCRGFGDDNALVDGEGIGGKQAAG